MEKQYKGIALVTLLVGLVFVVRKKRAKMKRTFAEKAADAAGAFGSDVAEFLRTKADSAESAAADGFGTVSDKVKVGARSSSRSAKKNAKAGAKAARAAAADGLEVAAEKVKP
ncbi:hypothetical protein BH09ACT10_BH09ACT10_16220 [soil metagenome]